MLAKQRIGEDAMAVIALERRSIVGGRSRPVAWASAIQLTQPLVNVAAARICPGQRGDALRGPRRNVCIR